ncbi:MAG: hypothetical protein BGO01_07000 [Armatimonadetes bacterium 55-13]|nr:exosortase-associated EpsI family protein [Armatimonadota bacterium]ODU53988.1 MAG: hypothetical protein ABT09_00565 [bacterium SCN 57-13]OJU62247.1 MAG: hypothetical protein BGO01_07000 [Armatimonadetes bacterium 55-13]
MERLKKQIIILAAVFGLAAVAFLILPSKPPVTVDEQWMKDHAPDVVDGFRFIPDSDDPKISYKMDAQTYEMLNPFGIVARTYRKDQRQFDVVLIAGNDKENFHDPHVCFNAQGWTFEKDNVIQIPTKTRGTVDATLAVISNQGKRSIALFFYRGPKGFYPSTPNLGLAMIKGPLMGDFKTDAVFYRFMAQHEGANEQDLIKFAGDFLDAAKPVSDGYF